MTNTEETTVTAAQETTKSEQMFNWIFDVKSEEVKDYLKTEFGVTVNDELTNTVKAEMKSEELKAIEDFAKEYELFVDEDEEETDEEYLIDHYGDTMMGKILSAFEAHGIKTAWGGNPANP